MMMVVRQFNTKIITFPVQVANAQKKNQDVSEAFLQELLDELGKINFSLAELKNDDEEIQLDIEKLYREKDILEYVLDAKKTQNAIDRELLNARHNFELVDSANFEKTTTEDTSEVTSSGGS